MDEAIKLYNAMVKSYNLWMTSASDKHYSDFINYAIALGEMNVQLPEDHYDLNAAVRPDETHRVITAVIEQ